MLEPDLMRLLQRCASTLGARLFRQNVGTAWVGQLEKVWAGKVVTIRHGDVLLRNARPFRAGVAGMSDLGGWTPVVITPEMVGQTVAIYSQVEVKTEKGRVSEEQERWINAVDKAGGRAGVARSQDDLIRILRPE